MAKGTARTGANAVGRSSYQSSHLIPGDVPVTSDCQVAWSIGGDCSRRFLVCITADRGGLNCRVVGMFR